MDRSK